MLHLLFWCARNSWSSIAAVTFELRAKNSHSPSSEYDCEHRLCHWSYILFPQYTQRLSSQRSNRVKGHLWIFKQSTGALPGIRTSLWLDALFYRSLMEWSHTLCQIEFAPNKEPTLCDGHHSATRAAERVILSDSRLRIICVHDANAFLCACHRLICQVHH